ncbi:hypothetical protein ECLT68_0572 [Escherichia coli LT-68]|nr:hypothetical protein ECLT68_0572 [Escherichia coli LT-68]
MNSFFSGGYINSFLAEGCTTNYHKTMRRAWLKPGTNSQQQ